MKSSGGDGTLSTNKRLQIRARHGVVPLGSEFTVILAILFSLLFIFSISLAFTNRNESPYFRDVLNGVASSTPGIVLLGESVDVDIDEPSITIRWTIIGCGSGFVLPKSPLLHGSSSCGMPSMSLDIFVDNSADPLASYDPDSMPLQTSTGQYNIVQNLMQFDSDHVLDVQNARLYPFDTYLLTSALRVVATNSTAKNIPIPIMKLATIQITSSFSISTSDSEISVSVDDDVVPARHLELRVRRPSDARTYAILIFAINWVLSHFNFGIVLLTTFQGQQSGGTSAWTLDKNGARKLRRPKDALKQLAGVLAVLLVIPQLRGAMPDAPGFDGVLLDSIGYFPQMALAGLSAIVLMLILAKREIDQWSDEGVAYSAKSSDMHSVTNITARALENQGLGDMSSKSRRLQSDGHSRGLSVRDVMLARMMRILDAGSQIFTTLDKPDVREEAQVSSTTHGRRRSPSVRFAEPALLGKQASRPMHHATLSLRPRDTKPFDKTL